jgi:outer membrane beta-barrel protein
MKGNGRGQATMGTKTMKIAATSRNIAFVLAAGLVVCTTAKMASAQEVVVTGPLAGAPAAHKLRLYREGRFELQPNVTFSLLDEYQREIFIGATLNYNISDSVALGVWGTFGAVKLTTALSDHIQTQIDARNCPVALGDVNNANNLDCRLTRVNLGRTFKNQIGSIDWMAVPQLTFTPFRGKIAFFQSLFTDTDLHFFVGPAFVGLSERKDCSTAQCIAPNYSGFTTASRTTITGAFGLGLSFFTHKWGALALDWRAVPFSRNLGGFDTAGTGPNKNFPDNNISSDDRHFRFNQFVSVGYSIFLPFEYRISE